MRRPWIAASAMAILVYAVTASGQVAAPVPVPDLTQPVATPERLSVSERPHPEFDPVGIRLGSFVVFPSLDLGETFDSNIYGTRRHTRSDFLTLVSPAFDLTSDWTRHALAVHAEGDIKQFSQYSSENVGNVVVQANGRIDVSRGQNFELGAGYQVQHEDRAAPDSEQASSLAGAGFFARYPTEFTVSSAKLGYVYSPRRVGLSVEATLDAYRFSNEPTANGALAINSDRNREEWAVTPRVSYEIVPGYQAFLQLQADRRQYDSTVDATPSHYRRGSSGYAVAAGSDFDIDHLVTGRVFVGYQDQDYDDARLSSNSGLYFGGSVLWNVTPLTSVKLKLARSIEETILLGSSGFFDTEIDLTIEHELFRNLLLNAGASYVLSEYQGIRRDDNDAALSAGARWRFNSNYSVGLTGIWQNRVSSQGLNNFERETVLIDFKAQI